MLPLHLHCANRFPYCPFCHEYDPNLKRFWISPCQIRLNMFPDVKSGSTRVFVPNEFSYNFVAQLLAGSGFEIPTHHVESEDTWAFILINSAAGLLSNVILDQRNVFPVLRYLHIVCIFAFDQCLHLSLHGLYEIVCSSETVVHLRSVEILVGENEHHKQSLSERAPDRYFEWKISQVRL